jgi:hypothetical protein
MAQHDYNLANQSGADFRADLNNALSAIVTVNSGATAPSTTFAHQLWVDTSSNVLKIRNAANDAWVTTGLSITADNTFTGNLTGNVTGNVTGDITGNADTATALETARTINGTSFDGTANISFDTDSVSEGSANLYYTSARFDSAFSGKSTSDLTEGTNLYFTNARVESYLDAGTSTPTFASAVINTSLTGSAVLDDDTFGTASATTVATSESIKAYVDSQIGSVDTLAEILLNGNTTGGTDIAFGDNDKAVFGTGSDLSIFHDGSHSRLVDSGTGNFIIQAAQFRVNTSNDAEAMIKADVDGAVTLYHNGSTKLATTSSGIDITGNATFDDNGKAIFGASNDLEIYHDGSSSYIVEQGQGSLIIRGGLNTYIQNTNGITMAAFGIGGTAQLRYNGGTKLVTNNTGIDVTGTVTSDGLTVDGVASIDAGGNNTHTIGRLIIDYAGSGNPKLMSEGGDQISIDADLNIIGGEVIKATSQPSHFNFKQARTGYDIAFYTAPTANNTFVKALDIASNGDISFYDDTGTTQGLFWDASTERLGIGTTSPSDRLSVDGNVSITTGGNTNLDINHGNVGMIEFTDTSISAPNQFSIQHNYAQDNDFRISRFVGGQDFVIDSSGNVGIGTDSPSTKLQVFTDTGRDFKVDQSVANRTILSNSYRMVVKAGSGYDLDLDTGSANGKITFQNNGSEVARFDNAGRLGIGTSSPQGNLNIVRTSSGATRSDFAQELVLEHPFNVGLSILGADGRVAFGDSADNDAGLIRYAHGNDTMLFSTAGTEAFRIDSSQRVGIGTTSPNERLQVDGNIRLGPAHTTRMGTDGTNAYFENFANGAVIFRTNNYTERMRINSSGNVGIGTASPSAKLDVSASSGSSVQIKNTGTAASLLLAIDSSQNSIYSRGATASTARDLRFIQGSSEAMRIAADGSVGIGTTSPSGKLTVSNAGESKIDIEDTGGQKHRFFVRNADKMFGIYDVNNTSTWFRYAGDATASNRKVALLENGGKVGIGTASPSAALNIVNSGLVTQFRVSNTVSDATTKYGAIVGSHYTNAEEPITGMLMTSSSSSTGGTVSIGGGISSANAVNNILFYTAANNTTLTGSERMRITSSGELLLNKTSASVGTDGVQLRPSSYSGFSATSTTALFVNRNTDDGDVVEIGKNGVKIGSIGVVSSDNLYIQGNSTHVGFVFGSSAVAPFKNGSYQDDTVDLGTTSYRFQDIYASNGTIQTSDINEKQDIEDLSEAETRVAVAAKGLLKKYRWKSAVADKGDDARIHFGIMAQDLQQAFSAEGLDAGDYGMFISNTWTDETTGEEKTRLGVRYNELLAFIIAAI